MGFHGLSPGVVAFSSRAFILNSEARVTVVCGVACVFGFSAKEFIERLFGWALLPRSDEGQQVWALQSCPFVEAAQNNLTLNDFAEKCSNLLSDLRKTF